MSKVSMPAQTTPPVVIQDSRMSVHFLPIEVGEGNGDDQYWLISLTRDWLEAGRPCVMTELRLRCRHCDFGHNSLPFTTVENLRRIGEEATLHVSRCTKSGRTIDLMSADIKR